LALRPDASGSVPATTRNVSFALPVGLLANPGAMPACSVARLISTDIDDEANSAGCPQDSQVGVAELILSRNGLTYRVFEPIYNMPAPGGEMVARLGFIADLYPVLVNARLRPDYGLTLSMEGAPTQIPLVAASTTLWGVPADASHDAERITPHEAVFGNGVPDTPTGKRSSTLTPVPFLVNPTQCEAPGEVEVSAVSYLHPEQPASKSVPLSPMTGCEFLDFSPKPRIDLAARQAGLPSGLEIELVLPQGGLEQPNLLADANLRKAVVRLPEGLAFNAAAAGGLGACSEARVGLVSTKPIRFEAAAPGCPGSSKIGEATIVTPALAEPLEGALYLASEDANPFGSPIAVYLVASGQGATLKLPIRFDLDPATGEITAVIEDVPPLPFSELSLRFKHGPRGVLRMPRDCGVYATRYELTSWAARQPLLGSSQLTVDRDCDRQGFRPSLSARTANPLAGAPSPFLLHLSRKDGEENVSALSLTLPPGLSASFADVPLCADALALAGTCPASSRVGSATIAAGSGPVPLSIPQVGGPPAPVYLAGPYKKAPFSFVVTVPVQAGPFDLGTVVTRAAIQIDPRRAQGTIRLDPLPQILEGIPIEYRDVSLRIDRPGFIRNPTSCEAMKLNGVASSEEGTTAPVSDRFQVSDCASLGFKPRLGLRFAGATARNGHPRMTMSLRPRPGEANLSRASVLLPRGALLDQSHLRDICAAARFAARRCPAGSIYGRARVWSPLLGKPLRGPVYLRESERRLPDLVADLDGQIHLVVVGHLGASNGRIRVGFAGLPDIPFSRVELAMKGARKGLLVNSEDLCVAPGRARVDFVGHNGRAHESHPRLRLASDLDGCRRPHLPQ